ncbi:zinc finger protein CONSTANS-like protein [Striga asiatica]|uniref:Zinc finger protein CONSTANS-like protein n=1 Tax=Striga asiatica TaxID=4170 RepID=A0A5A7QP78_STRAF|nr:zinc finger protein CONSTANS-like protein [Striga asiatica]
MKAKMYAETELMSPYFHNFSQEVQQFEEAFCWQQKPLDLWAPEPIIEDPTFGPDPLAESSIESECLLNEVFYECEKDLLAKEGNEMPLSEELKIEIPNEDSFLDFPVSVYGMRRAFSDGDIKTLDNNGNISQVQSPAGLPKVPSACASSEDRKEKLYRYWSKKSRRNFDRKIKYACRKALADSQPRVRGRFAKIEVSENCKKQ